VSELFFGPPERFGPLPFEPQSLDREMLEPELTAHLWDAFSSAMLQQYPQAQWYAEKLAVPIQPLVDAKIPMKVVDCVRDPRDVLVSIRSFSRATASSGFGQVDDESADKYVDRFVETVAACLDDIAATPSDVDHLALRYEDFARDIPSCAAQLETWLDVELDPGFVEHAVAEIPAHRTSESVDASIGRWRRELPTWEADKIWAALGPRLEIYGYTES
jgi:hypothetical protein